MDVTTLKAKAYDLLANIEYLQKQLVEVNQQIAEQMQKDEAANSDSSN